jgi:hypothetical protein
MTRTGSIWLVGVALASFACGSATAADQTILGRSMVVKNPNPGDPSLRKVTGSASEKNSTNTLVGDPVVAGALLTVIANGNDPTQQDFPLPQALSSLGRTFWDYSGSFGFKHTDSRGEQGPVKSVSIRSTPTGVFTMKVKLIGKNGVIDVVPPNPGTNGSSP